MQIGRVVGTLVSTQKHKKFEGAKLLLVQPIDPDDAPRGNALLAIDGVGAGVGERVLVVLEGRAAGEALGQVDLHLGLLQLVPGIDDQLARLGAFKLLSE